MGQIVFNGQRPKYCNLQAIRQGGQHVNDVLALKEVWLVDTTNSNKGDYGTGRYDAYIVGDDIKTAGQLPLNYIDTPIDLSQYSTTSQMQSAIEQAISDVNIPRNLNQLIPDNDHQTVSQSEKDAWSSGSDGGNPVDNEDLTLTQDIVPVIKFKDRAFSMPDYSSLGRKYLRKNIQTVPEKSYTIIAGHYVDNPDYEFTFGGVIDISTVSIGGTVNFTPAAPNAVFGYCIIDVNEGDSFLLQAFINTNNTVRAWGFIDSNNILLQKSTVKGAKIVFGSEIITAPSGASKLIVNIQRSLDINYRVSKIVSEEEKELNVLTQEMFDSPNTAYIIQYDYTLNFGNITLPENSVLVFDGGSIINGAIIGNHSRFIDTYKRQIFNLDTYLCGTWDIDEFYPEYFGAIGNGTMDCYLHIQKCLDTIHYISTGMQKTCMLPKTYKISHGLLVYENTRIKGNSIGAWTNVAYTLIADFENKMQWVIDSASISWKAWETYPIGEVCPYDKFVNASAADNYVFINNHNIVIEDIAINGVYSEVDSIQHYIYGGIRIQRSSHSHINDVYVGNVWIGIAHAAQWYHSDRDLWVSARNIAYFLGTDCNQFTLYNGYLNSPSAFNDVDVSEYTSVSGQLDKPTNIVCCYSKGNLINPITEGGGYAYSITGGATSSTNDNTGCNLYISHPYIEGAYSTYFTMDAYTKCVVMDGVYVGSFSRYFLKTTGNHAILRLIGYNDSVSKIINHTRCDHFDSGLICDNSVLQAGTNIAKTGNFFMDGNLVYSRNGNKYFMKGYNGIRGLDGYNYQTSFTGFELPSEEYLKVGTPFMLVQSDRTKPVFESVSGTSATIQVMVRTLPTVSGNVTFTILGTDYTIPISYFTGIGIIDIAAQAYKVLSSYYRCYHDPTNSTYQLFIAIPYTEYQNAESTTLGFEDTDNTGLTCTLSLGSSGRQSQYIDCFGNSANFEYRFSTLPETAVEGTIGYWTITQQPVYFKNGGWYDFPTNTKQELLYEFSDHTTDKTVNVEKTGGTFNYVINSELNGDALGLTLENKFNNLVTPSLTDNQDGTFSLSVTVSPTVYTSEVDALLSIYQYSTGKILSITYHVAAGESSPNIVISNEALKNALLYYDKNSDGELSYDESLAITNWGAYATIGPTINIQGTSTDRITVDLRILPNFKQVDRSSFLSSSNYINVILPPSFSQIGYQNFSGMKSTVYIVCLAVTPPALSERFITGVQNISRLYVPDSAVQAYKDYHNLKGDKYKAENIFPISSIDDNNLRAVLGLEPLTTEGEQKIGRC